MNNMARINRLKKVFIIIFCILSNCCYAQFTMTHAEAKEVFSDEILDLDPVEGIYDVQNNVVVSQRGYGAYDEED